MQDNGKRLVYETGALREPQDGKGRFDLISPFALFRLARWYELGAKKYGYRNWEKGIPFSHCVDSAFRHLTKFLAGMDDEDHLAAVAWNVFAIMHYQELGRGDLDDLPRYRNGWGERPRIYLAGAIQGRKFREVWEERMYAARVLEEAGCVAVDPLRAHVAAVGIAPESVWEETIDAAFQERLSLTDAEIVRRDKDLLATSDALLILTGDTVSSGTWLEFGYAKYARRIPVVVIAKHPTTWTRVEADAVVRDVLQAREWFCTYFRKGRGGGRSNGGTA